MSQPRRSDLRATSDAVYTDDNRKFKKAEQTFGRPEVTDHDINDEYMRDAPNNQPSELSQDRKNPGKKEGAWEVDEDALVEEGVLEKSGIGRPKKEEVLGASAEEDSLHPNDAL
ncbi:hypothetical protein BDY19DRAFT_981683 [Irpex rosettiformis]|uniref:Uncharacterized protein n=1 Tax=Irpex rosettiformis TaxID=378272 RepID=A0ACB8TLN6_9APHY|nr:hypothetical protein BDY19DRAFT_981683 [Irpex rosettiformis]